MGLGEMITTPAGTQAARLVSDDEISMEAVFDTPGVGAFNIGFDYWFQTTDGTLDVLLDGQVIHTISAPILSLPISTSTADLCTTLIYEESRAPISRFD